MALGWPSPLKPTKVGFWLEYQSRGGGPALNGMEQRVYSPDQRWRGNVTLPIRTEADVLNLRSLIARADGSANAIDVPAFEGVRANWPVDTYGRRLDPGFTRRRQLDGTIYEDPRIPTQSAITATLSGAHAIRAISMAISLAQGSAFKAGQFVSVGGKLHILRFQTSVVGSVYTFEIRPPLRAAYANGTAVNASIPTCEMRLLNDEQAQLELDLLRYATLTLQFCEYF